MDDTASPKLASFHPASRSRAPQSQSNALERSARWLVKWVVAVESQNVCLCLTLLKFGIEAFLCCRLTQNELSENKMFRKWPQRPPPCLFFQPAKFFFFILWEYLAILGIPLQSLLCLFNYGWKHPFLKIQRFPLTKIWNITMHFCRYSFKFEVHLCTLVSKFTLTTGDMQLKWEIHVK